MSLFGRWVAIGSALAIAAAAGCGVSGTAVKTKAKSVVSPCGTAATPAWSPDGKQIAWYGQRWPLPPLHHRPASTVVLRAFCVMDADGKHVQPLRYTVCSEHCSGDWDGSYQLDWVQPGLLLYGNDSGIFTIALGQKPQLLSNKGGALEQFSVDAAGDRVAEGSPVCFCAGPVRILSVSSGAVVGVVGGTKLDNTVPSLSPDGKQVVFARSPASDSGRGPGLWIAAADGSHLRRLEQSGDDPLWSPAGNRIAYLALPGATQGALRLVAPQGGKSTTLLRSGVVGSVFGWSPDGRLIAFSTRSGKLWNLAVVAVATGKVQKLRLQLSSYTLASVVWSPNSQQLLVAGPPPAHSDCPSGLWQVPVNGAKSNLVHGC